MAKTKELSESTSFTVSVQTLGGIAFGIATVVGMWFALQADIAEAKELPVPPPPDVTRMEYDMKDQLIRQTIMTTQDDVKELKEDMKRIEEKIDKILSMENTELAQSIQDQGANIRAIIDEVEERKSQLESDYNDKLKDVEKLVLPLLINLTKNPERESLLWPDRSDKVKTHINRILEVTRG